MRTSDRTASLRNAGTPIRQEVYYFIEGEVFPVVGVASARDPVFKRFQDPEVVGPGHRLPQEWLPGAQSIISFFFPYSE
ncbi:MAG TPA: hypothetical protein VN370_00495 [Desulfitobacteriaceae bacterium]|nr:hypothetical protein [Desulfitobacteriaceae bacterium]